MTESTGIWFPNEYLHPMLRRLQVFDLRRAWVPKYGAVRKKESSGWTSSRPSFVFFKVEIALTVPGVETGAEGRHCGSRARPSFCRAGKTWAGWSPGGHFLHGDARQCRPGPPHSRRRPGPAMAANIEHKHLSTKSPAEAATIVLVFVNDWQLLVLLPSLSLSPCWPYTGRYST
jgi:hypothetical protein